MSATCYFVHLVHEFRDDGTIMVRPNGVVWCNWPEDAVRSVLEEDDDHVDWLGNEPIDIVGRGVLSKWRISGRYTRLFLVYPVQKPRLVLWWSVRDGWQWRTIHLPTTLRYLAWYYDTRVREIRKTTNRFGVALEAVPEGREREVWDDYWLLPEKGAMTTIRGRRYPAWVRVFAGNPIVSMVPTHHDAYPWGFDDELLMGWMK